MFTFDVRGQKGAMPSVGMGTATLHGEKCIAAVRAAIKAGYRNIDTALLYMNQEAVGEAIRQAIDAGDVQRDELWITTKVGFYPAVADGKNAWIPVPNSFHELNKKGKVITMEAIDLCLKQLQLDYVDLVLIHNPCTDLNEYQASACPHHFELSESALTSSERDMVLQARLGAVKCDRAAAEHDRAETWKALEEAKQNGKCRFIGVSNYPPLLIRAMESYATTMPAVNQLELHPRFSSPSLRAFARESGMVLMAYGTGNSVAIAKRMGREEVVRRIAQIRGLSALAVVLRWTLQHGIAVLPRSADPAHIADNLRMANDEALVLSDLEMSEIDELNEAHPYYWWPIPLLPPGTPADVEAGGCAAHPESEVSK